jgi:integrase
MAIEKITRAKGIIYRAVWVNPITGRRESKSFDNELDAKQHEIDRRKTARDDPQAFSGPPPSTTFSSIALRYLREADLSESTKDVELYNLDIAINPVIGAKDAASLTKADAREIERLCKLRGNKQNTIKRKIATVKAILSWAVEHEIIDTHPLRDYKCKQGQNAVIQPPSVDERNRIWAGAEPHLRRAIILATCTGARVGASELFSILWEHVDFGGQTITIWSAEKNKAMPYRVLDVPSELLSILAAWKEEDGVGITHIIHYAGKPIKSIKRSWKTALERAKITRRIRPYDMRHFFATEAIRGGADLKAVAEILGHANLTMILKHYQHTIREQKRTAMNAITVPPDQPAWVKRGDQGPKKAPKVTHEEKNILQ